MTLLTGAGLGGGGLILPAINGLDLNVPSENCLFAYSPVNIIDGFTGAVIRGERSSDSTQQDFTADEVADGTLTAWASSGDVEVVTYYQQGPSGNNATGVGGIIVESGTLITQNGYPAIKWPQESSGALKYGIASNTSVSGLHKIFLVGYRTLEDQVVVTCDQATPFALVFDDGSGSDISNGYSGRQYRLNGADPGWLNRDDVHTDLSTDSPHLLYLEGDETLSNFSFGKFNNNSFQISNDNPTYLSAFICYNSSANDENIESSLNAFYSFY